MKEKQLQVIEPAKAEMSVPELMRAVIDGGINADSVGVMTQLVALKREMDKDSARVAFNRAFVALQRDLKSVVAQRTVPGNDGKIRYRFAAFEDLMAEVAPHLDRHDFSLSFTTKTEEGRLCVTATLMHVDGHERSTDFAVRSGKGAPGCSDAQTDGGAFTFAKRYAMCGLLNIVIDKDTDAALLGDTISKEEAVDLEKRILAISKGDEKQVERYLKLADSPDFKSIKRAKYEVVIQLVEMKERAK